MPLIHYEMKHRDDFYVVEYGSNSLDVYRFVNESAPRSKADPIPYTDFIQRYKKSGRSLFSGNPLISGFKNGDKFTYFDDHASIRPEDFRGSREWSNHCLFDLQVNAVDNSSLRWQHAFSQTQAMKIMWSERYRKVFNQRLLGRLYVTFPEIPIPQLRFEIMSAHKPILLTKNVEMKTEPLGVSTPENPIWKTHFWSVKPVKGTSYQMSADDTKDFDAELAWNSSQKRCEHPVTLDVVADAGYLPIRKVSFNKQGKAKFRVSSLGLRKGDQIELKFASEFFLDVGRIKVRIV